MGQQELIESLHRALHSAGCTDADVHFILDWIRTDVVEERRQWQIAAVVAFIAGVALGVLVGILSTSLR